MRLSELISEIDYELLCGSEEVEVTDITNDSRRVGHASGENKGQGMLYFAVPGDEV